MVTKRLLERDPDDLERYLVEQGRLDRAPEGSRRRALANVAVTAAGSGLATVSATSSLAAAVGSMPFLVAKWAIVGVASAGAALGLANELRSTPATVDRPSPSAPSATVEPPAEHLTPREAAPSPLLPEPATVATALAVPPAPTTAPRKGGLPKRVSAAGESPATPMVAADVAKNTAIADFDSSLEKELELLDAARSALDTHGAQRASAALDRYVERFPNGRMRIEAMALRVEALFALGQREQAASLGRAFLAAHVHCPAAIQVRRLVDNAGGSTQP
ncbi:MAG TPA: hypothetical protein VJT73_19295 [Polyangiaceae bacterium]|nr:hypothetical protein [Polyangiaceae bacterium]